MNMLKSSGPKTDPCGTPTFNSDQELKELLILVLCHLFDKYDLISLNALLSKPYACNLAIRRSWFIVSNALDRSINTAPPYPPLSRDTSQLFNIASNECCAVITFTITAKKRKQKIVHITFNLFLNNFVFLFLTKQRAN